MILLAYHTSLAAGLLFAVAVAYTWLLRQIPTRSLDVYRLSLNTDPALAPAGHSGHHGCRLRRRESGNEKRVFSFQGDIDDSGSTKWVPFFRSVCEISSSVS